VNHLCQFCGDEITLDDWREPMYGEWVHKECADQERELLARLESQDAGRLFDDRDQVHG